MVMPSGPVPPSPTLPSPTSPDYTRRVPDPLLEEVENATPFDCAHYDLMGKGRQFYDIIAIKGTYRLAPGRLERAGEHDALNYADRYDDERAPETSSLKAADDWVLYKPGTDILMTGTAHSPGGIPRREWGAVLGVRRAHTVLLKKILRLTGPRIWQHRLLGGWTLSAPEETTAVPLRYELAYGGHWPRRPGPESPPLGDDTLDTLTAYDKNPTGSGFFGKGADTTRPWPGPQIEYPDIPIRSAHRDYAPAGFGPIAPFWPPRADHAGTYDETWHEHFQAAVADGDLPDYPDDFDERFFQSAPADQILTPWLTGDETLTLGGVLAEPAHFDSQLPGDVIHATLWRENGDTCQAQPPLDTVHIDLDRRTVSLVWRLPLYRSERIVRARLALQSTASHRPSHPATP